MKSETGSGVADATEAAWHLQKQIKYQVSPRMESGTSQVE